MATSVKVDISKSVSENLSLRDIAGAFFDTLDAQKGGKLIIDFKRVKSISRSFAHEYLKRKSASRKNIVEVNVPQNVAKMFEIVSQSKKASVIDWKTVRVISV
jgi:sporulation protein YlmC with PRC-barrel domain